MILKILFKEHAASWSVFLDLLLIFVSFKLLATIHPAPISLFEINEAILFVLIQILSLIFSKSYNFFLRYTSLIDVAKIVFSLIISSIALFVLIEKNIESLIFVLLNFFVTSSLLISYRLFIKYLNKNLNENSDFNYGVLIFGCGSSGILTKRALYNNTEFKVLGFVDDDESKLNMNIDGVKVFGINKKFENFIQKNNIDKLFITTKKISSKRLKFLYNYFQKYDIQILEIPPVNEWINGAPRLSDFKEIKIQDLLGRELIDIDLIKNEKLYKGKFLMVTGAAGSIGSEIVRQLLKFNPSKIILLDNAETPMFTLREEMKNLKSNIEFIFIVGSVTNKDFINEIFKKNKINIVFHAAAYKHVNMMELNPKSAVYNNIYGTKIMVDTAINFNIDKFIIISSDKAVNPTNVMGATKRICELYLSTKLLDKNISTSLIYTRFGNVLGSNGSVVPIFSKQIKSGGPVKITHPDIVRYFMTIGEATQLVLEAGAMSKGGEVYIFDMGAPVKILDLAKKMIIQSGFKPYIDIDIEYIGLRPGEKLYEEILVETDDLEKTHNKLIYIVKKEKVDSKNIKNIQNLINFCISNNEDNFELVKMMKKIVPEFKSKNSEFQILDNA